VQDKGAASRDAFIVLAPGEEARPESLRTAATDRNGKFTISGLPPGDYVVLALDRNADDAYIAKEYRERFRDKAVKVKVPPSGRLSLTIDLIATNK
jgi:hypothetical protein